MVKEEGVVADAGGGGRGYLDMLCLGEDAAAMDDYFHYPSPSSSSYQYQHSSAAISAAPSSAVASPGCASYLQPPPPLPTPPYHNILSFGGDAFGFPYYGGAGQAIPVAVPQKSSPTAECTSSISSMSSSPTATAASAISISKPQEQAPKKKGSRSSDQRKAAAPAAAANKRPRVRREKLGERIQALQQLVSPFGKSDTASVLHEALGYIRFLHDQVQVLSSPYMQRLPPSARGPASKVEQRAGSSDLRSRGLCLVPVACTEHVTGGVAGVWSSSGLASSTEQEGQQEDEMLRGDHHPGQLA